MCSTFSSSHGNEHVYETEQGQSLLELQHTHVYVLSNAYQGGAESLALH